ARPAGARGPLHPRDLAGPRQPRRGLLGRSRPPRAVAVTSTTYAGEVLWVVPVAELGGVARHVVDVASHGIPRHRLSILCPDGPLAERLRSVGARVTTGPVGPATGLVRSIRTVRHTVLALRPSVVHSHLAYADIVVAATPLPAPTRRFTTEHGIAGDDTI